MHSTKQGGTPSFLVVIADQLAARWLPMYGQSLTRAPALEALARHATVFESAYCPFPLCAPSRAAMVTGRYASRDGVYDNAAELPATVPTLAHRLRAAGYYTAVAGKMHFVGPDQRHGFEDRLTPDIYPADVDWTPDWSRPLHDPLPWYHTMESVLAPGVCAASMQTDYDDEVAFHATRSLKDIARHRADQPFLLVVSFTSPHDPWEIPARYWARYARQEIPPPSTPALPLDECDPHSRRLRLMCGVDAVDLSPQTIQRARHAYFASVSYLDDRIGEVLRTLQDTGLADDTIVVFCADHGEFLGERGLWYKMSFLEPSAHVPFIVRVPGETGQRRIADAVSLVDLTPTLLECAGQDSSGFDGVSLAPALTRATPAPAHPVIAEYHAEGVQAASAMVRVGAHKLILSLEDPDLLYDLGADPEERTDLSRHGAYAEVRERLRHELEQRLDLAEIDRAVRRSQRERHLISAAHRRGRVTSWDFEPPVEAGTRYVRNRETLQATQERARLDSGDPDDF